MSFYKLSKKEYKKVAKEFRKTHVGSEIFSLLCFYTTFLFCSCVGMVILDCCFDEMATQEELLNQNFIEGMCFAEFSIVIFLTLFSYHFYINHLKKYYDENHSKKAEK